MLDCTVRPSRASGVSIGLQLQKLLFTVRCFGRTDRSWLRLRGLEHTGEHADMTFTFARGMEGSKGKNGVNIYKAPQEFSRSPYLAVAVNRMDI